MSASPAQPPSGKSSATPTSGPPAPVKRKKAPVSVFHSKKKPVKPAAKPVQRQPTPSNGSRAAPVQQKPQPQTNGAGNSARQYGPNEDEHGSFHEYPIFISKRVIDQGIRYHAAKLHSKTGDDNSTAIVNPYDESQFVRPLRLHRRYARDKMETADADDGASGVEDKEREQMTARRAERQAEREENQKLIAPTGGEATRSTKKKPQKKVEEGRDNSDPVRQKRMQLRYEEARPWHLEDFEGKNIWIGSYEQALSEHSIMLTADQDGIQGFRMVPVEKWYKFIQTNKVNSMDSEEVEKHMNKKFTLPRWALGTQLDNEITRRELHQAKVQAFKSRPRDEDEVKRENGDGEFEADKDMLDPDVQDEFQDDDEGMLFQGDEAEDAADIEKRIYLEMREAGLGGTGVKNEDVDPEEEERKKQIAEREEKKKSKRLRRQLTKKEHQGQYLSDSDSDPYASSSESMDSDEEREKAEEDRKKEEEARKAINSDKSGSSTLGNNTPSGRSEKRLGSKRPGDDSDLSGNESSQKRAKVANGSALSRLVPGGGRSTSPDAIKKKLSRSGAGGSGSGSDTDSSRVGRPKPKLKTSPPGSPSSGTPSGSRAASPAARSPLAAAFPTLQEVKDAIPPDGIEIKKLVAHFKSRLAGRSGEFITLVKAAGTQDKATQKIKPKPA